MSDLFSDLMEITQTHVEELEVRNPKPEDLLKDFENGPNEQRVYGGIQINQQAFAQFTEAKENKTLIKDILQMDAAMVDTLYSYGHEFFTRGRYFEAFKIFRLLVVLNISDYRFVFGLAECLKHLEFNNMAFQFYTIAAGLDPKNPIPYFCAAESAQDIGNDFGCLIALEKCLVIAKGQKKYSGIHHKALGLYEAMISKARSQLNV